VFFAVLIVTISFCHMLQLNNCLHSRWLLGRIVSSGVVTAESCVFTFWPSSDLR